MSHLPFTDREVERVLAGQQPYGRPDLAEVAYFVARLRTLVDFEPPPEMSPELRAQVEVAEVRALQGTGGRRSRVALRHQAAAGSGELEVIRLGPRRQARSQTKEVRWRWRLVGAAAAAVMIGGIATASLRDGDGREVETEADTVDTGQDPTTTAEPGTENEPPAASSGEPARPTVPSGPPATEVDTDVQAPTDADDQAPQAPGPPEWMADVWPPECAWPDWACACEQYGGESNGDACWYEGDGNHP